MATRVYHLTLVFILSGWDESTRQTVTIPADTLEEAVQLAQVVQSGLPSETVISATLADKDGKVLWSKQHTSSPCAAPP